MSWVYVGIWIIFTIQFFIKLRNYSQFNSPHNTSFFQLGPISIGLGFLYFGYYTDFLAWNLLEEITSIVYLNPWILIFSFPYLFYSLISQYSCFRTYEVVYLYKDKSLNARAFGILVSVSTLIFNIGFMIFIFTDGSLDLLEPNYSVLDLVFVVYNILLFLFLVVFGLVKQKPSISEISPEAIRRRRQEVQRIARAPARRQQSQTSSQRIQQRTSTKRARPKPKTQKSRPTSSSKKIGKEELIKKLNSMKPKAGVLSLEDFKCIFCFQLPSLPEDKGRGVILCPSCKHPAHADEFRDWTRNSGLCSRCDSPLPASFRRNPKIIPTSLYLKAIKYFKKKGEIR